MKRRSDGRYVRTVTIDGKRKMFYSSEPTEKKAERDIMRQMVEFKAKKKEEARGKIFEKVADDIVTEFNYVLSSWKSWEHE